MLATLKGNTMLCYHVLMTLSRALAYLPLRTMSDHCMMQWMFDASGSLELLADEIAA